MGCIFSAIADPCPNRQTQEMYFLARVRALAARGAIVEKYNDGLRKFEMIAPRMFADEHAPVDADRMTATLESVGIPPRLLWFVRHAIRTGPAQLPTGWGTPKAADVLENIDLVDAPTHEKRDFVDFMACPFNADAFRSE